MAAMMNMNNLLNGKDSRWLQLEVCREFQRNKCSRQDTECKFAHPPANVEVQNGKVTACYDSIKGRCNRDKPPCKYFHPPQHLKDQLLINGRNHLALKNAIMQQMGIAPGQQVMPGQVQTVATNPYLTGIPTSTYNPYFGPGHLVPALLGPDPSAVASQLTPVVQQAVPVAQQKIPRSDRLEVCREFMRGACKRAESECRFAHPKESVTTHEDGTVTVCMDAVKGRCARDPCRYFHPPLHLQAQIKAAQSRASATSSATAIVSSNSAIKADSIYTNDTTANLTYLPSNSPMFPEHLSYECAFAPLGSAITFNQIVDGGKKRAAENDLLHPMDMKSVGSFYYENFAFSGMVPYKRPAAEKSGIPVYQANATTYQQLMQMQQPFVPVSCEYPSPSPSATTAFPQQPQPQPQLLSSNTTTANPIIANLNINQLNNNINNNNSNKQSHINYNNMIRNMNNMNNSTISSTANQNNFNSNNNYTNASSNGIGIISNTILYTNPSTKQDILSSSLNSNLNNNTNNTINNIKTNNSSCSITNTNYVTVCTASSPQSQPLIFTNEQTPKSDGDNDDKNDSNNEIENTNCPNSENNKNYNPIILENSVTNNKENYSDPVGVTTVSLENLNTEICKTNANSTIQTSLASPKSTISNVVDSKEENVDPLLINKTDNSDKEIETCKNNKLIEPVVVPICSDSKTNSVISESSEKLQINHNDSNNNKNMYNKLETIATNVLSGKLDCDKIISDGNLHKSHISQINHNTLHSSPYINSNVNLLNTINYPYSYNKLTQNQHSNFTLNNNPSMVSMPSTSNNYSNYSSNIYIQKSPTITVPYSSTYSSAACSGTTSVHTSTVPATPPSSVSSSSSAAATALANYHLAAMQQHPFTLAAQTNQYFKDAATMAKEVAQNHYTLRAAAASNALAGKPLTALAYQSSPVGVSLNKHLIPQQAAAAAAAAQAAVYANQQQAALYAASRMNAFGQMQQQQSIVNSQQAQQGNQNHAPGGLVNQAQTAVPQSVSNFISRNSNQTYMHSSLRHQNHILGAPHNSVPQHNPFAAAAAAQQMFVSHPQAGYFYPTAGGLVPAGYPYTMQAAAAAVTNHALHAHPQIQTTALTNALPQPSAPPTPGSAVVMNPYKKMKTS